MNEWISINDKLPENYQRCLIWDRSCHVSFNGKPETICHIYVAHFYKGEHRPNGPWRSCDTGFNGNNKSPWCWEEGARTWFSQDVLYWMPLPDNPIGNKENIK